MTENELKSVGTKIKFQQILDNLQLTDRQKEIFVLKYGRGFLNEDIAAEIGYCRKIVSDELRVIRHKMAQLQIDFF